LHGSERHQLYALAHVLALGARAHTLRRVARVAGRSRRAVLKGVTPLGSGVVQEPCSSPRVALDCEDVAGTSIAELPTGGDDAAWT